MPLELSPEKVAQLQHKVKIAQAAKLLAEEAAAAKAKKAEAAKLNETLLRARAALRKAGGGGNPPKLAISAPVDPTDPLEGLNEDQIHNLADLLSSSYGPSTQKPDERIRYIISLEAANHKRTESLRSVIPAIGEEILGYKNTWLLAHRPDATQIISKVSMRNYHDLATKIIDYDAIINKAYQVSALSGLSKIKLGAMRGRLKKWDIHTTNTRPIIQELYDKIDKVLPPIKKHVTERLMEAVKKQNFHDLIGNLLIALPLVDKDNSPLHQVRTALPHLTELVEQSLPRLTSQQKNNILSFGIFYGSEHLHKLIDHYKTVLPKKPARLQPTSLLPKHYRIIDDALGGDTSFFKSVMDVYNAHYRNYRSQNSGGGSIADDWSRAREQVLTVPHFVDVMYDIDIWSVPNSIAKVKNAIARAKQNNTTVETALLSDDVGPDPSLQELQKVRVWLRSKLQDEDDLAKQIDVESTQLYSLIFDQPARPDISEATLINAAGVKDEEIPELRAKADDRQLFSYIPTRLAEVRSHDDRATEDIEMRWHQPYLDLIHQAIAEKDKRLAAYIILNKPNTSRAILLLQQHVNDMTIPSLSPREYLIRAAKNALIAKIAKDRVNSRLHEEFASLREQAPEVAVHIETTENAIQDYANANTKLLADVIHLLNPELVKSNIIRYPENRMMGSRYGNINLGPAYFRLVLSEPEGREFMGQHIMDLDDRLRSGEMNERYGLNLQYAPKVTTEGAASVPDTQLTLLNEPIGPIAPPPPNKIRVTVKHKVKVKGSTPKQVASEERGRQMWKLHPNPRYVTLYETYADIFKSTVDVARAQSAAMEDAYSTNRSSAPMDVATEDPFEGMWGRPRRKR